ncbi:MULTISPECIES: glycosyltransferase family 4 protein [unclassified Thioalkalivibrio]|uniref:glycosyltransferase family 4 protein n=1 Tax=unclassified Thioalkalivibrio TaxID=2621013 RepID=UPI0003724FC6|nr:MULTISPECIES: glycosyltransferase family 4 protein [unclassified Thioalkalivibrio]
MKILIYMDTPGALTGAPRRALSLAKTLSAHDVEVWVASEHGSELLREAGKWGIGAVEQDRLETLTRGHGALLGGGPVFKIRIGLSLLRQNLRFWRLVRRLDVDGVWIRGSRGIALAGVGTVLSRKSLVWDVDYEPRSEGVVRLLHRFALWASSVVVFQYRGAPDGIFGRELSATYVRKFNAIIPGVEFARLEEVRRRRKEIGAGGSEPFTVLQVGMICERKNQLLIVDAMRRLGNAGISEGAIRVRVAGAIFDEEYASRLRQSLEEAGLTAVFEILGWREDVAELMADADLLVMPSKDEGVPNTVQEAMYIGLPVVVSPVGGMPEIVQEGDTGWIEPLDDPEAWFGRIRWCMDHREETQAVAGQAAEYAKGAFSLEAWGEEYAQVVRAAGRPGGKR